MSSLKTIALVAVIGLPLLLAGCAGQTTSETNTNTTPAPRATLQGHQPSFDITAAEEEGYWYSRYNLGQLIARSGIGEMLIPPAGAIPKMMAMIDADFDLEKFKAGDKTYGDGDHFVPFTNPHLIKTVYAGGDPHYTQKPNPADFATLRWNPAKFDQTYTGEAFGWLITKELEWMKQFHGELDIEHFGPPEADYGAKWRMVGSILMTEAKMQFMSYLKLKEKGAIRLETRDQIVLLEALSDLHGAVNKPDEHALGADAKLAGMLEKETAQLFGELKNTNYTNLREAGLAAQALVWYGAEVTDKATIQSELTRAADYLQQATPVDAADRAYRIRGLAEAKRVLRTKTPELAADFGSLVADYDWARGYFRSQTTYSIDEVGAIFGALNSLRQFPVSGIQTSDVEDLLASFFESTMDLGGMQQSAPPVKIGKSPYEYEGVPELYFRHPAVPMPPKVGIAPVFASEITFDQNTGWQVTDSRFDTAGGMHAANEMIWFHADEVNGFPKL